ncbi:MAG: hypothetical protein EOL95_10445, partial [Bacteroidia bacterium]|nr:hypothetical protein [Bacteroidia bacterium]
MATISLGSTESSGFLYVDFEDIKAVIDGLDDGTSISASLGAKLENISEDTTPELGGELDCGANSVGFTMQTATGDGTTTIDWKLGNKFKFTFGAQSETFTFTAPTK